MSDFVFQNQISTWWRTAILIGRNTAVSDDPALTIRYWQGAQPLRVVLDRNGTLPSSLKVFSDGQPTLLLTQKESAIRGDQLSVQLLPQNFTVKQVLESLQERQMQSVLVEGGARVLQSFLEANTWDEIRLIINPALFAGSDVAAPVLNNLQLQHTQHSSTDIIHTFYQTLYYKP
jgi:diaminohydroxyphosphoribosylaminopyrimidine deaminase / 5-amino-6-(5-phosphoribosylamino)uracil reductase